MGYREACYFFEIGAFEHDKIVQQNRGVNKKLLASATVIAPIHIMTHLRCCLRFLGHRDDKHNQGDNWLAKPILKSRRGEAYA